MIEAQAMPGQTGARRSFDGHQCVRAEKV